MASQNRPEPMNATSHHSKVKVALTLGSPLCVAGEYVAGKMEVECRADKGLGVNLLMVELFAVQELTSRDHSATATFIHSRRLFQGPGLPPSNAVQAHPLPGDPPLPPQYHQARRGVSTFLFRIPIPSSSPSSINFGAGLARVKYEVKATAQVYWKGEKRLVTDRKDLEIAESYEEDFSRAEPEGTVVGENGKIWIQGKIVGGVVVAGESACVELQVKNHSTKKNTGLAITLSRALHLPRIPVSEKSPLQITDTLTSVSFRGPEYIVPPGAEGVASLVFDVPKDAKTVRGGTFDGDETEARTTEAIFEVRCVVGIKMSMGLGCKDIVLDLPVQIVHPAALPAPPPMDPYPYAQMHHPQAPYLDRSPSPYAYPAPPMSPPVPAYVDQNLVWLPPPVSHTPQPYPYYSPPVQTQPYYFPPPLSVPVHAPPPRPSSAGPSSEAYALPVGLPATAAQQSLLPLPAGAIQMPVEAEEGKGERASRITHHLRGSSRNRSVSPLSHRYPLPVSSSIPIPIPSGGGRNLPVPPQPLETRTVSLSPTSDGVVHSPRPVLSPKQSYATDLITQKSLPKSERVEDLERMAAEVGKWTRDLSADIPKASEEPPIAAVESELASNTNKTLPGPPVPTATDKLLLSGPSVSPRPRVDTYFAEPPTHKDKGPISRPKPSTSHTLPTPMPTAASERTPPTPTLTAVMPAKLHLPRSNTTDMNFLSSFGPNRESGLDALEKRLLAEVGTRKLDAEEKRPDVRAVLPISIPSKPEEPLNDSAISSLTLADHGAPFEANDHDSDERTHKGGRGGKSSSGEDHPDLTTGSEGLVGTGGRHKSSSGRTVKDGSGGEMRSRKKGDKMKKAAKGRVAAWLGEIEAEVPPVDDEVLPSPISTERSTAEIGKPVADKEEKSDAEKDPSSAPNPRSSGFVPIGTLKRDPYQRTLIPVDAPISHPTASVDARKVAEIWSSSPLLKDKSPVFPKISPPALTPQSVITDRGVSPPSSSPIHPAAATNPWQSVKSPAATPKSDVTYPPKLVQPSPRLPSFPPSLDPEVKYDIRSARGGRGGKVASVAAIWSSGAPSQAEPKSKSRDLLSKQPAAADASTPKPLAHRPSPKSPSPKNTTPTPRTEAASRRPVDLTTRLPARKPVVKSASIPALLSSSHAKPTLSSTASLARPAPFSSPASKSPPVRTPPAISELRNEPSRPRVSTAAAGLAKLSNGAGAASKPAPAQREMAFGQAKLRDLIKKYQGQPTK